MQPLGDGGGDGAVSAEKGVGSWGERAELGEGKAALDFYFFWWGTPGRVSGSEGSSGAWGSRGGWRRGDAGTVASSCQSGTCWEGCAAAGLPGRNGRGSVSVALERGWCWSVAWVAGVRAVEVVSQLSGRARMGGGLQNRLEGASGAGGARGRRKGEGPAWKASVELSAENVACWNDISS